MSTHIVRVPSTFCHKPLSDHENADFWESSVACHNIPGQTLFMGDFHYNKTRLHHLVDTEMWALAMIRIQSHPDEVCREVFDHGVELDAPVEVLEKMIKAKGSQLFSSQQIYQAIKKNASDELVLFLLKQNKVEASKKTFSYWNLLTQNNVEASKQTLSYWNTLYVALEKKYSLKILCALVEADPTILSVPLCIATPPISNKSFEEIPLLDYLWKQHLKEKEKVRPFKGSYELGRNELYYWVGIAMVLNVANYGTLLNSFCDDPFREMLHSVIGYEKCPSDILSLAFQLHSNNTSIEDRNGNLPLHVAVGSRILIKRKLSPIKGVIQILLKLCSDAASVKNDEGRIPLNIALESGKGWNDGVKKIVEAAPDALGARDIKTHMYPFMLAASMCKTSPLETTYRLLRACPEVVKYGIIMNSKKCI